METEENLIECPACAQPMKPAHIVCPFCITDGKLRHQGAKDVVTWTEQRDARVVEALLCS